MPAPSPHRRQQALSALSTLSKRDLAAIWAKLNLANPDKLAEPLAQVLAGIADKYGAAAAALAADWYDEARDDAGAPGSFRAVAADLPDQDRFDALARWGIGPLFDRDYAEADMLAEEFGVKVEPKPTPDPRKALSLLTGGLSRIVLDQARDTTFGSVALDPARPRFARHASANACAFCALMATRGAVYASEDDALRVTGHKLGGVDYRKMRRTGASRESILAGVRAKTIAQGGRKGRPTRRPMGAKYHDDCHCVAVEVFPGTEYAEAPYVAKWRDAYNDASGHGTKAVLSDMRQALGTN